MVKIECKYAAVFRQNHKRNFSNHKSATLKSDTQQKFIINLFLEYQKNYRKSIYLEDVIRALEKVKHGGLKKATLRIEIVFVWVVNGYLMLFFVSSF